MGRAKTEKFPMFEGFRLDPKTSKMSAGYIIGISIKPADFGLTGSEDNATMAAAVMSALEAQGAAAATARAEAAEQRAEAAEAEVARLRTDSAILGRELSEANRLLLSGIPQRRGAAAERAAIAHTLRARAQTLRDMKALGVAEEVEALAFYVEQRGEVAEGRSAEVSDV